MYVLVNKGRLLKESSKKSKSIEKVAMFGREWEPLTHTKKDKNINVLWMRETEYKKLTKERMEDGVYLIQDKKFRFLLPKTGR